MNDRESTIEKEIFDKEGSHEVKIAVMARDIHYMAKDLKDIGENIKKLDGSFVKRDEFDAWKRQEFNDVKLRGEDNSKVLLKHSLSINKIINYGGAFLLFLTLIEIGLNIYKTFN